MPPRLIRVRQSAPADTDADAIAAPFPHLLLDGTDRPVIYSLISEKRALYPRDPDQIETVSSLLDRLAKASNVAKRPRVQVEAVGHRFGDLEISIADMPAPHTYYYVLREADAPMPPIVPSDVGIIANTQDFLLFASDGESISDVYADEDDSNGEDYYANDYPEEPSSEDADGFSRSDRHSTTNSFASDIWESDAADLRWDPEVAI